MLLRPVALLPGSSPEIFSNTQWLALCCDQESHELWVDANMLNDAGSRHCVSEDFPHGTSTFKMLTWWLQHRTTQKVVFFDFFHAAPLLDLDTIQIIQAFQNQISVAFVTICKLPIAGINNVFHFDYYWNRTKSAYLDKKTSWKQGPAEDFNQWPIHTNARPYAMMSLTGANSWHHKKLLHEAVSHISGYHSSPHGKSLHSDSLIEKLEYLVATPPARKFFDDTYVSAQIESMFAGPNVVLSEKTYDHLIQGRFVMNFGPRHYYQILLQDGWRLPDVPNFEWDNIDFHTIDLTRCQRFKSFIYNLKMVTADISKLHEIFLRNLSVFEHNQQLLLTKPYDIFDLTKLDDK